MILILSTSELETSTDEVVVWLKKMKADFVRLNGDDIIDYFKFELFNDAPKFWIKDKINNREVSSDEIKIVWYRRKINNIADKVCKFKPNSIEDFQNVLGINSYHYDELIGLYEVLELSLQNVIWINKPTQKINKILMLLEAKKAGVNIPYTFIQNTSPLPINKYITKPIKEVKVFKDEFHYYPMYTSEPSEQKKSFFPSLFQEKIEKKYEIRSFYLDGDFYSIAVFSQQNENTKVDYRNIFGDKDVDISIHNSCAYTIPKSLEEKLKKLMNKFKLKSGSIDLIKGVDEKYYFLEVNTVGQFGNVSDIGKYNLEKKIAEKLIYYDN